jgi:hypothetical protein
MAWKPAGVHFELFIYAFIFLMILKNLDQCHGHLQVCQPANDQISMFAFRQNYLEHVRFIDLLVRALEIIDHRS